MEKIQPIDTDKAEEIISKIKDNASVETDDILRRAEEEASRIMEAARKDVQLRQAEVKQTIEREKASALERNNSALGLEKKRIFLSQKNILVESILQTIRDEAIQFRQSKEYADFLSKAISEGMKALEEKVEVLYSASDEKLINRLKSAYKQVVFTKSDFKDIGVIVQSLSGRMIFDNRFAARLKRKYEDLHMRLLREVF